MRRTRILAATLVIAGAGLAGIEATSPTERTEALPPPAGAYSYGAAGTARNGTGGSIAPSPTSASWPGTGAGQNGGPFAFVGAHYGSLWGVPAGPNNARGVGYCVMEDVGGEGAVTQRPDPPAWDATEMASAAALMATFGGDAVVPYGIDETGSYDTATGEWQHPMLLGGGDYTRRRQIAVNFGVRMFLEDQSPTGVAAGRKLARDTAVVNGTGGNFSALSNGYRVAQHLAGVADVQHAIGGVRLEVVWGTPGGVAPTAPGKYPIEVHALDATGRHVGLVPVLQLSGVGIGANRSVGAIARVDNSRDTPGDAARWNAATAMGWPVWQMNAQLTTDPRFEVRTNPAAADVAGRDGIARFTVEITAPAWELAFHTQAPTADTTLHAGTGVQGQVTWAGPPQSASVRAAYSPPPTGHFRIRKVLDDPVVQGDRDMSGFSFEVVSDTTGASFGTLSTDTSGRTPRIQAVAGRYRLSEVARPPWATGTLSPGPIIVTFDPVTAGGTVVEFTYTNRVPAATIDTVATDAADGDHVVDLDGTATSRHAIVDRVSYCGLVPGTPYELRGAIVTRLDAHDGAGSAHSEPLVAATTAFTPTAPCGTADVHFEVDGASMLRGTVGAVFETLVLAANAQVVATHADPLDADQTIWFPLVTTRLHATDDSPTDDDNNDDNNNDDDTVDDDTVATTATSITVADEVTYAGLEPTRPYRAVLTLHERTADAGCAAEPVADPVVVEFTPTAPSGTVTVGAATLTTPGTFVAFERIERIEPPGPDGANAARTTLVATHTDCDEALQTVTIAPPPPPPPPPPPVPTTTALPQASTTTIAPTTTTTPASTTTVPVETTPPTSPPTTPPVTPPPTPQLPRTGGSSHGMTRLASLLVLTGAGLFAASGGPPSEVVHRGRGRTNGGRGRSR